MLLTKPTVLNVSQNYHLRGGSDRVFLALAELLEKQGHQVIPFTAAHPRNQPTAWDSYFPVAADFEQPGLVDLVRFIYSRAASTAIRRLLHEHNPDIAHLHIYYGKLTGSVLAPLKRAGIPIVQTLHEYKLICPVYTLVSNGQICEACEGHHFWRAIPRKCNRNSLVRTLLSVTESYVSMRLGAVGKIDHFIAVSDFVRDKMVQYGVPAQKITTVHNFLDSSTIVPNYKPGEYFLYFGRLERIKGIFTLLEAAAPLKQAQLLIVGDGKARREVAELIERRNLKHIRMLGFKQGNELSQLIQGSLCTIVPSEWYETFGLTVLESFAHARPVIASRIGGIPEIVTHGTDGFLVSPGNPEALREKMEWIATHHRTKAMEMGLAGRRKVETQFDPETHYQQLMEVYRQVL
jgi:glycosyltransferase involved in cell wall biosynthesis